METLITIALVVLAYLLGSIPTAVWLGKKFYGIDVRDHGSGNAGATNTIRVLGWKAGGPVFLIDVLKGFAAANIAMFTSYAAGSNPFVNFQLLFGFVALIGHIFPVFASFRGGKGVATLLGLVIALTPLSALWAFCIFLVILFAFKYVSLGSIIAGIFYPFIVCWGTPQVAISLKISSIAMALALLITHRKNIVRLLKHEESKASFLYQKKNK